MMNELIKITPEDLQNIPQVVVTTADLDRVTAGLDDAATNDFYRRLRHSITHWAKGQGAAHHLVQYILLAPDLFLLLIRLLDDDRVSAQNKAKVMAALAYFVMPLDVVPEILLGPAGYVDDIALAAFVLHAIVNQTSPEVVREHWPGEEDILRLIQQILAKVDSWIGSGAWQRVRQVIQGSGDDSH